MRRAVISSSDEDDTAPRVVDYETFRFQTVSAGAQLQTVKSMRDFENDEEMTKFMSERIVIRIDQSEDPLAPPTVLVGNNGDQCWLPRNVPIRVPRSFAEILANSRTVSFRNRETNDADAIEGTQTRSYGGRTAAFQVLQDPNPKGAKWLAKLLQRAA